jgi:hypothetical protein
MMRLNLLSPVLQQNGCLLQNRCCKTGSATKPPSSHFLPIAHSPRSGSGAGDRQILNIRKFISPSKSRFHKQLREEVGDLLD